MQKHLLEPVSEVLYEEGSDGMMRRECVVNIMSLQCGRGTLLFRQIRKEGQAPYVLVFGWRSEEDLLSNGMLHVRVNTVSELQKEMFCPDIRTRTEGKIIFW